MFKMTNFVIQKGGCIFLIAMFFAATVGSYSNGATLVANYKMENNTDALVIDSAGTNDMTKYGSPTENIDVPLSYSGNLSLEFHTATSDNPRLESMDDPNGLRGLGGEFTIEMWIKPTSGPVTPSDPEIHFLTLYSWTSGEYLQIRARGASNAINVFFGNKVNTYDLASLVMNQWQHLAVTVNNLGTLGGIDIAVYLDGTLIGSASGTSPMSQPTWKHFYLGTGDSRYSYGGLIDDVKIWKGISPFLVENCGDTGTVYLAADLDKNCYVNVADFAVIAAQWLQCTDPNDQNCDQYWIP